MARVNRHGCPQPPLTPEDAVLAGLREQRALLYQQMISPVQEIEAPMGRTMFRDLAEMERQLAILDGLIGGLDPGVEDPNAWRKTRRPLYPVPY